MNTRREYFDYSTNAPASFWRPILAEAESTIPKVYSATFFAKHYISIVDQQVRAFNLSFALSRAGKVTSKTRVAIVGAGISGMTCAVALTMLRDCHCALFDADSQLLRKFREASFRFIHPDLNASTDSDSAVFDDARRTNFAFLNWSANPASVFAEEFCKKFDHYRMAAPISLHLNQKVDGIRAEPSGPVLTFSDASSFDFDLIIVATGFGDEKKSNFTTDASYWHSGNPVQYERTALRNRSKPERVLISGNGDSGILELAHFLIRDFQHKEILRFLPSNDLGRGGSMGLLFAQRVSDMWFRQIELGNEEFPNSDGPVSWYRWFKNIHDTSPHVWASIGTPIARKYLLRIFSVFESKLAGWTAAKPLARETLIELESQIAPVLDELASIEIENLVNEFNLDKLLPAELNDHFRNDFDVTIAGPSRTIYSRRQAPQNWFFIYILNRFGAFKYLNARFDKAEIRRNGILVTFRDRDRKILVDRLIVRQGATYDSLGYTGLEAKEPKSQFRITHLRNLEKEVAPGSPVYHDAFIEVFQTKRWQSAIARRFALDDRPDSKSLPYTLSEMVAQLDVTFLYLRERGLEQDAYRLYRLAKRSSNVTAFARTMGKIFSLVASAHSEKLRTP